MWPDQFSLFRYSQSFVVLLVSQVFYLVIFARAFHRAVKRTLKHFEGYNIACVLFLVAFDVINLA